VKDTWLFPIVQSLHVVGLGLMVGTIALGDWRVLRREPGEALGRWIYWGLALMVATGAAMFFADSKRYLSNPAFSLKMGLVLVGVVYQFLRRPSRWGAYASISLWTAVVLASRLVEDFDK
jgi:hypothetical protein